METFEEIYSKVQNDVELKELNLASTRRLHRERRKLKAIENKTIFFRCLLVLIILIAVVSVDNNHEPEVTEESKLIQYTQTSVRGDTIPAKGFSSIEDLEPEEILYSNQATFKVTHYCGCSKCCGKWSSGSEMEASGALGTKLTPYKSVAVDKNLIPLGTKLYDADGNEYIAEDTGSGVNGYHIDLFVGNHNEAWNLGVSEKELFWNEQ